MKVRELFQNEYMFSTFTRFIAIGIGILQSILVARYLGTALKGVNAYITSITSIGAIVVTFGFHHAYPYYRKKFGKELIYSDYISIVTIVFLFYFIVGIIVATVINAEIKTRIIFILIPLLGYSRILDYVILIETPNVRNKWSTLITCIDVLYVLLLFLFTKRNLYWGLSILLFADVLKCIIYISILKVRIFFHKRLLVLARSLFSYGFFPMLALLMTTLNYKIDILMLHRYSYITDSMIGVYSLAISLSDHIVLIPDTLKGVLASKLAKGATYEEVAKVSRIGVWTSVFFFLVISAIGRWVITIFYGYEYIDAYPVVIITSFGIITVVYFKFIAQYNIVNKRQILNVFMLSVAIVTDVVLNLFFIPLWGINGAAIATSIGNIICGIVFVSYFCKKTGIKPLKMFLPQKDDMKLIRSLFNK